MQNKSISSAIFHFTGKSKINPTHTDNGMANLIKIISNGFRINFCKEVAPVNFLFSTYSIPMVCFCDIPLMRASNHSDKYGKYAIGLSKAWAVKNRLEPVIYLHEKSIIKDLIKQSKNELNFVPYTKIMNDNQANYKEENEWRFVPSNLKIVNNEIQNLYYEIIKNESIDNIDKEFLRIAKSEINKYKNDIANTIKDYGYLKFDEKDICYILLKRNSDIKEFIKRIDENTLVKDRDSFLTKITTFENIDNYY